MSGQCRVTRVIIDDGTDECICSVEVPVKPKYYILMTVERRVEKPEGLWGFDEFEPYRNMVKDLIDKLEHLVEKENVVWISPISSSIERQPTKNDFIAAYNDPAYEYSESDTDDVIKRKGTIFNYSHGNRDLAGLIFSGDEHFSALTINPGNDNLLNDLFERTIPNKDENTVNELYNASKVVRQGLLRDIAVELRDGTGEIILNTGNIMDLDGYVGSMEELSKEAIAKLATMRRCTLNGVEHPCSPEDIEYNWNQWTADVRTIERNILKQSIIRDFVEAMTPDQKQEVRNRIRENNRDVDIGERFPGRNRPETRQKSETINYWKIVSKNSVCYQKRSDLLEIWNKKLPNAVFHFPDRAKDTEKLIPRFLNDLADEIENLCPGKKEVRYKWCAIEGSIVYVNNPVRNPNNGSVVYDDDGIVME